MYSEFQCLGAATDKHPIGQHCFGARHSIHMIHWPSAILASVKSKQWVRIGQLKEYNDLKAVEQRLTEYFVHLVVI